MIFNFPSHNSVKLVHWVSLNTTPHPQPRGPPGQATGVKLNTGASPPPLNSPGTSNGGLEFGNYQGITLDWKYTSYLTRRLGGAEQRHGYFKWPRLLFEIRRYTYI